MSEDYKYACQRAELLGLAAPIEEEWVKSEEAQKRDIVEQEDQDDLQAKVKYLKIQKVYKFLKNNHLFSLSKVKIHIHIPNLILFSALFWKLS